MKNIAVFDLFAGPGGLGEGFSAFKDLRVAVRGLFLMVLLSTLIIVGMTFLNISLIEEVLYGLSILARLFVIAASASVIAFIALSAAYQIPRLFSKVRG